MPIFENGKYPIKKGKYPMQDPCRNGLVSDGRKKPRLIKEKNPDWWQKKIPTGVEKIQILIAIQIGKVSDAEGKVSDAGRKVSDAEGKVSDEETVP